LPKASPVKSNEAEPSEEIPPRSFDRTLSVLSKELGLPDDATIAAKRIMLRMETETSYQKQVKTWNSSPIVVRAALFLACRQIGIPKTFNEFQVNLEHKTKSQFHKQFKLLDSALKKDALNSPTSTTNPNFPSSFSAVDFIHSEWKALGLTDSILNRALEILKYADSEDLFPGRRPSAVAAIILSFAARLEHCYLGGRKYAEAGSVSQTSIVNGQKVLLQAVEGMSKKGQLPPYFRLTNYNIPSHQT
jgi:transcription initiation factor TFIIIB Brf1 subunit/transcription initiation factor TFIIB